MLGVWDFVTGQWNPPESNSWTSQNVFCSTQRGGRGPARNREFCSLLVFCFVSMSFLFHSFFLLFSLFYFDFSVLLFYFHNNWKPKSKWVYLAIFKHSIKKNFFFKCPLELITAFVPCSGWNSKLQLNYTDCIVWESSLAPWCLFFW